MYLNTPSTLWMVSITTAVLAHILYEFKRKSHANACVRTIIFTLKSRQKGPVVNIRGRHLQMLSSSCHVLTFTGGYLYSKPIPCHYLTLYQKKIHISIRPFYLWKSVKAIKDSYINYNGPPCPVFGTNHHLPLGSCVHSHTIFNIFTVIFYLLQTDFMSNSWTTSDQTIVKCPCALTAFLNSWHIL